MIRASPWWPSVASGEDLVLHVSTTRPAFRVDFYRWGSTMELAGRSGWLPGHALPDHLPFHDWAEDGVGLHGEELEGWPPYAFPLPPDWRSGVYVAVLTEGDGNDDELLAPELPAPDGRHSKALFVVTNPAPTPAATILYKVRC